ncbi:hypothetical protein CRUP_006464 [Coryphaenoides rupestris]|nr:hypothetical protein CRUP_006464 [Coryphaenoides rupestris]
MWQIEASVTGTPTAHGVTARGVFSTLAFTGTPQTPGLQGDRHSNPQKPSGQSEGRGKGINCRASPGRRPTLQLPQDDSILAGLASIKAPVSPLQRTRRWNSRCQSGNTAVGAGGPPKKLLSREGRGEERLGPEEVEEEVEVEEVEVEEADRLAARGPAQRRPSLAREVPHCVRLAGTAPTAATRAAVQGPMSNATLSPGSAPAHLDTMGCISRCKCTNGGRCDFRTGACQCPAGFTGADCSSGCPLGHFGKDCALWCSCGEGGQCHPATGRCICGPGRMGHSCQQALNPSVC